MKTSISLLNHINALLDEKDKRDSQRFDAQSQAIKDALQAAKEAVAKAEVATEKRFESVNEFRKTLSDQTATFIPRAEYEQARREFDEKITTLRGRLDKLEGRSGGVGASIAFGFSVLAGAAAVAALIAHWR